MGNGEGQPEALTSTRAKYSTSVPVTLFVVCTFALARVVWRLPIPLTVFGAGLVVLAGDVGVSRLPRWLPQRTLDRIVFLHYLLDICAITFAIHQLGGAYWMGALFYLFVILYANFSLRRAQGLVVTAICIIAFVSSMLLSYAGLLPQTNLFPEREVLTRDPVHIMVILVVGVGGLLLFSLVFGGLADVLHRRTDELRETNARLHQAAEQLRGHRDELERAVERRTRDLRTALGHLRSAHEELKRSDHLKTTFLANVSHELRTPLTSIRSFAEILLKFPEEESASREEFLQIIAAEADRLERLIDDVLDLTKIESGHVEWSFSSVELPALLSFCVRSMQPLADAKQLLLAVDALPDLPPVRADRDRIAQVLNNLLGNALKFAERGTVTVGAAACDGEVRVYVSDTGPGIPEAERTEIFKKFHQIGGGLTSKPRGTGLGLAISAEIVAGHGGRIWVDSVVGRGSTFHFTLPVDRPESAAQPASGRARPRKLVLIADSDPAARRAHREALEQAGYAVKEAADGRAALRLAAACAPDLICIDVLTPELSGLAVLRALRGRGDTRDTAVIIISVMEEDKQGALGLGAACHLVKPVAAADLVAAAADALAARGRAAAGDSSRQETLRV